MHNHHECDPKYASARKQAKEEEEKRSATREKASKRYRKGWVKSENCSGCGTKDFEYTTDWKYLVPKTPIPADKPLMNSPWTYTPALN